MGLEIRPAGESDEATLRSLYDWLRLEQGLTANAEIAFGSTDSDEGTLGASLPEYLSLLPFAIGVIDALDLVASIDRWIKARRPPEGVVLANSRGETVLIKTSDDHTVAKVADLLAAEPAGSGDEVPDGLEGSGHGRTP
ncbi:MAG: effector-associated constant component EACC1 [Catenulispora sp.]